MDTLSGTERVLTPIANIAIQLAGGGSASLVTFDGDLKVETWSMDALPQADTEPILPARQDDVEELLRSHFDRLDGVYRRLT